MFDDLSINKYFKPNVLFDDFDSMLLSSLKFTNPFGPCFGQDQARSSCDCTFQKN